jgi:hypothetical protein
MTVQVVRPAGAGHETLWVSLAAVAVLALAALVVGVRAKPLAMAALAPHQIDARTQLNAAEQGVHADLLVAAEDIAALHDSERAPPGVDRLREMGLPPFSQGPEARARGGHEWRLSVQPHGLAYTGLSAAPELAASFVLIVPTDGAGHGHAGEVAIWVRREGGEGGEGGEAAWPEALDDPALMRQGWRQVVTRYDAGVTRQDASH